MLFLQYVPGDTTTFLSLGTIVRVFAIIKKCNVRTAMDIVLMAAKKNGWALHASTEVENYKKKKEKQLLWHPCIRFLHKTQGSIVLTHQTGHSDLRFTIAMHFLISSSGKKAV